MVDVDLLVIIMIITLGSLKICLTLDVLADGVNCNNDNKTKVSDEVNKNKDTEFDGHLKTVVDSVSTS